MFSFFKAGQIEYLQSSLLADCDFLTHAFCTRRGGVSQDDYKSLNMSFKEGDEDNHVLQNWGRLAAVFNIPLEQFLVVNQVHKDDIFIVKPYGGYFSSRAELDYDAIMTDRVDLAICVKTADCVPVFIVDRVKKVIAVVHAGWRGSALGISARAVRLLQDNYGSAPQDILAAIGPSIGQCCYQVLENRNAPCDNCPRLAPKQSEYETSMRCAGKGCSLYEVRIYTSEKGPEIVEVYPNMIDREIVVKNLHLYREELDLLNSVVEHIGNAIADDYTRP